MDFLERLSLKLVEADLPDNLEFVLVSHDGRQAVALTKDGKIHGPLWRTIEGKWQKEKPHDIS